MIIAIDVGNTNIVIGCYTDGQLTSTLRLPTASRSTADDYRVKVITLFHANRIPLTEIEGGILSSVVPAVNEPLVTCFQKLTGKRFHVVNCRMNLGFQLKMDKPEAVGVDLLVDAAAAVAVAKPPLAVFDLGTCTTLSVIDREGSYISTHILPGLGLSMKSLSVGTAQLPNVSPAEPKGFFATNTVDSMTAGVIYGHAAMMDGLIQRVEQQLGEPVTAIATGGLAGLVLPHCVKEINYQENLLLDGLYALYRRCEQ